MAARQLLGKALRRAGEGALARGFSKISSHDRPKKGAAAAADELASSLRKQAAEALAAAQQLAKGTAEELFSAPASSAASSTASSSAASSSTASSAASSSQGAKGAGPKPAKPPSSFPTAVASFLSAALAEMRAAVLPEAAPASALRGAAPKAGSLQTAATSELVAAPAAEEAAWARAWREASSRLSAHPLFRRLRRSAVAERSRAAAEGLRERWETSDSPLVHRLQDAADALAAEPEAAAALREARARDPAFELVDFLRRVRGDVRDVVGAYLRGAAGEVVPHCSPEMAERLSGILAAQAAAGLVPDPTLLDVSEVELVDLKLLDGHPVVVAQFTCQQINCTRDAAGNVVEGAPDEVHRVYYFWALQQEAVGYVGADGAAHPPRWRLREMLVRGMHHLL